MAEAQKFLGFQTPDGTTYKPWADVDDVAEIRSDVNTVAVGINESLGGLANSYERLSAGIGDMVLMTTEEYQPALEDLLSQLN